MPVIVQRGATREGGGPHIVVVEDIVRLRREHRVALAEEEALRHPRDQAMREHEAVREPRRAVEGRARACRRPVRVRVLVRVDRREQVAGLVGRHRLRRARPAPSPAMSRRSGSAAGSRCSRSSRRWTCRADGEGGGERRGGGIDAGAAQDEAVVGQRPGRVPTHAPDAERDFEVGQMSSTPACSGRSATARRRCRSGRRRDRRWSGSSPDSSACFALAGRSILSGVRPFGSISRYRAYTGCRR